jgi:hypothetical protein
MPLNNCSFAAPCRATLLAAVLSAGLVAAAAADDEHSLVKISEDPYTDPAAQHRTEVEPLMVAHDDTIVTSIQVGRFFTVGSDNIGWATSRDAGETWHHGFLTGTTTLAGGVWPAVGLPVPAYDRKHHTYLIAMMPFDADGNGRGIMISRSADGLHWSAAITAAASAPTFGGTNGHWLACDNSPQSPFYGNCYDGYLDLTSSVGNFNDLIVSNDGGVTWSAPIYSPDSTAGLPTSLAVQPNGNLFVLGRNGGPNGDQAYAIPSVDGGVSLQPTVDIATHQFDYPYLRADPSLTSAVDWSGTIYVAFPDCRFRTNCSDPGCRFETTTSYCAPNDLLLTTSKDGLKWTALKRIPIDPVTSNVDHLIAGLAAQSEFSWSATQLVLTYYFEPNANLSDGTTCTSSTCLVSAGSISSHDGGRTWHKAQKIAGPMEESWLVPTDAGEMVANYNSAVFVDGEPFGAFAIARPPNPQSGLFEEAAYAAMLPEADD